MEFIRECSDIEFIKGLMAENYNALGFIPIKTVEAQYIQNSRYIIQRHGKHIGYLLHGKLEPYKNLTIAQSVIDIDHRRIGYGNDMLNTLIERARQHHVSAIKLRCAEDLPANAFWRERGFKLLRTEYPNNKLKRAINIYELRIIPTFWDD